MFGKKSEKLTEAHASETTASETAPSSGTGSTAAGAASRTGTPKTAETGPAEQSPRERRHPQEKKGAPTPTRREREAARKRPLVTNDPKEARRQRREARAAEAEKVRESFKTGDERYLPPKHRGANRRLVRKVVDERFRIPEIMIFVLLPFVILSLVLSTNMEVQKAISNIFMAFILLVAVEVFLCVRSLRKRQAETGTERQRGDVFYVIERIIMFRKFRTPAVGV
ncbi:DUF3043 domain-containing protein [Arthrobacter sp. UM1]|uniref:DUF3043 domain-containing protein n=1 Tax=Arthrobacter sp. UM1 TaxID=2766776 RepID=UPI001CF6B2C7|nr:DUF3043 domain-containing protein [Arthrobacter sp. UM1]MCB4207535.1 DUF3043 domain-containing protein [Arthrobacter sp. UM1]